jgi:transposase-like protein
VTGHGATPVFAGFRFPREVISLAVRGSLRYGRSCRDVEGLLAGRGRAVGHVTSYRWVPRFTPEFTGAARPRRPAPGDRWPAGETAVQAGGAGTHLYRAVDQHGPVLDVLLPGRREWAAARRSVTRARRAGAIPAEVTTDRAPLSPRAPDGPAPAALPTIAPYATNPVEADHGRRTARPRPMRGRPRPRSARILAAGHAFAQNPAPRSPRHRCRSSPPPPAPRGIRRPRTCHLNPAEHPDHARRCSGKAQRNSARGGLWRGAADVRSPDRRLRRS